MKAGVGRSDSPKYSLYTPSICIAISASSRTRESGTARAEAATRADMVTFSLTIAMSSFDNFYGNAEVAAALREMIRGARIPQTLLFSGPEGIGKATLARRFGAALLGGAEKIEQDDLSLEANRTTLEE